MGRYALRWKQDRKKWSLPKMVWLILFLLFLLFVVVELWRG